MILSALSLALWTPLTEEILFRGFIFRRVDMALGCALGARAERRRILPVPRSAILILPFNPGLYASVGAPGVLIPIFLIALLFGWLYRQTGSLWSSVAAHAVQNGMVVAGVAVGG